MLPGQANSRPRCWEALGTASACHAACVCLCALPWAHAGPWQVMVAGWSSSRGSWKGRWGCWGSSKKPPQSSSALGLPGLPRRGSLPAGPLRPPHPSSRPPQVALATFEPSWFVKAIRSFGFPGLGRSPGTAKPKAKRPALLRPGTSGGLVCPLTGSVFSPLFLGFLSTSRSGASAGSWVRFRLTPLLSHPALACSSRASLASTTALLLQTLQQPPQPPSCFRNALCAVPLPAG